MLIDTMELYSAVTAAKLSVDDPAVEHKIAVIATEVALQNSAHTENLFDNNFYAYAPGITTAMVDMLHTQDPDIQKDIAVQSLANALHTARVETRRMVDAFLPDLLASLRRFHNEAIKGAAEDLAYQEFADAQAI